MNILTRAPSVEGASVMMLKYKYDDDVGRSFGRRERLLKHLETHGIHELAHEPRAKKPKEEQEPTNPAYANLRKTYPKKEPIKQEPDFNMPGRYGFGFGFGLC